MAWRRRRGYGPYDSYDPRNRPRGGYYEPARGSSCLRDACLIDAGCCLGEALAGNCLVLTLPAVPRLLIALAGSGRPAAGAGRGAGARMIAAVRVYQRDVSAHRPACCRFSPTCSDYAAEALHAHGALWRSLLTLRRLARCRPGGRRGHDPGRRPARDMVT